MDPKLLRYYKKKMSGGRSIVARTIDFIMFRAFLLFFIFVVVLYLSLSTTVALLISIFLTTAVSLAVMAYGRKRAEKFIIKDMLRLKQKCLLEKLTFMNPGEYAEYINRLFDGDITGIEITGDGFRGVYGEFGIYALHNHPGSECSVGDALKVYRSFDGSDKLIILSLSEFSAEAERMLASLPGKTETIGGKSVLKIAESKGMLPDEAEAEENALKEMNETIVTLEKVKDSAFSRAKIKGYIICGIIIMAWPLVNGFRIYYPIIAIVCFTLAIITYKKSRQHDESSDVGAS